MALRSVEEPGLALGFFRELDMVVDLRKEIVQSLRVGDSFFQSGAFTVGSDIVDGIAEANTIRGTVRA